MTSIGICEVQMEPKEIMAHPMDSIFSLCNTEPFHLLCRLLDLHSSSASMSMIVVVVGGGMAADHQPETSSLPPDNSGSTTASYFPEPFLAKADLHTMREAALVSAPASEHVALDWSCLADSVNLENALFLAYSTHRTIRVLYITVPKIVTGHDVAAAGFPATSLRRATRFQNLVYDFQDVHWSVVGKAIHDVLKQDAFWTKASQAYKMNRLETVKERPALPAVRIAGIARTRTDIQQQQEAAGIILPRMSKKSMKRLQPAYVKADLAELARPTWQQPPPASPSLLPDVHDADRARWV